jgi:hypothetical protein
MDVDTSGPLSGGEMGRLISASRHTLHRIEIRSPTPPDVFPVIFDLPRLRDLILQEPRLPNQIPPKTLPGLQTINFNGNHGSNLPQFLRSISVSRLAQVRISRGGAIEFSALLDSLRGAAATMNMFHLSPVTALDRSSITLLSSFTNLTSLTIGCVCESFQPNGPCSFQPTDENI